MSSGTIFKKSEIKATGYGNKKVHIGAESYLPFGHCCLSLKPIEDCLVSPSGHLYEKESIIEYLLQKTKEIKEQKLNYEKQEKDKEIESIQREIMKEKNKVKAFIDMQQRVTIQDIKDEENEEGKNTASRKRQRIENDTLQNESCLNLAGKTNEEEGNVKSETATLLDDLKEVNDPKKLKTSASESEKTSCENETTSSSLVHKNSKDMKPPLKRPPSPMTKRPLRVKDLISVKLPIDLDNAKDTHETGRCICQVTREKIGHRPAILIVTTGTIILQSVYEDIVRKDKVCPLTGNRFEDKDVLHLVSGGTSQASRESTGVEVTTIFNNLN